ncbi:MULTISPECIES: DHH family phosphoesterase [Methylomonas]|uniref:DHH family phosphoesterase n=1 Tax=Methylomonas TaxID=416 RepID=UPI001231BE06|nr:DHH family phosphoesterase [Methylomonas rhizoryzae]
MNFDVFNGDADGICALIQLRLAEPRAAKLITGVKRDISLLKQVDPETAKQVTVLDIALEKNREPLTKLLDRQVEVFYVDHHNPGADIPKHPGLQPLINTDPNVCTSLLVDRHLEHQFSAWAVTAAFGDNLASSAQALANRIGLEQTASETLKQLGICINYNAYGESVADLHFPPEELFELMRPYRSPLDFIAEHDELFRRLSEGYANDLALAWQVAPEYESANAALFILPDERWSRRVSGVWSNDLANRYPDRAHAVLSHNRQGGYTVSVRAPLHKKAGADELCAKFPTGGGRKAAAGINHLPHEQLDSFIANLTLQYS